MGKLRGQKELEKYNKGRKLTPKEAIKAHCYQCNGEEDGGNVDCKGSSCPLYQFFRIWVLKREKVDSTS